MKRFLKGCILVIMFCLFSNSIVLSVSATGEIPGETDKERTEDVKETLGLANIIELNSTNFPNEVFREYLRSCFDKNSDNALSKGEISGIKKVDLNYKGIDNLEGIEFLTSVDTLYCGSNNLSSLDLSKNTALEVLECDNNKLTTLNLRNNKNLFSLNCEFNQLTDLDLSQNKDLYFLYCDYNQLAELDISNNTMLSILDCSANNLKRIDVSKLTDLRTFRCYSNQLENIDVSANLFLADFSCDSNKIGSIDVSKNDRLTDFSCGKNQLTSLNVKSNPKLLRLGCNNNQLRELDLTNNTKLESLYCENNLLSSLYLKNCLPLCEGIKKWDVREEKGITYHYDIEGTFFIHDNSVNVISVIINPTSIVLDNSDVVMLCGDTYSLKAILTPSNVTEKKIIWISSNSKNATVNNGVIKAIKAGKTVVIAKTVNGLTAQCNVAITMDNNPSNPFADLKEEGWQYTAARYVYDKGYMNGKGEIIPGKVLFDPNAPINRSQFVQTLYNVEGKPPVTYIQKFSDVHEGDWYAKPVTWAKQNGIVAGNANGTFGVNGTATREQLAQMFYKYAKYKGYNVDVVSESGKRVSDFPDADKVSNWAENPLNWALSRGIMSGKGSGKLDPKGSATRAECATMLRNFMNAYKDEIPALKSTLQ